MFLCNQLSPFFVLRTKVLLVWNIEFQSSRVSLLVVASMMLHFRFRAWVRAEPVGLCWYQV